MGLFLSIFVLSISLVALLFGTIMMYRRRSSVFEKRLTIQNKLSERCENKLIWTEEEENERS